MDLEDTTVDVPNNRLPLLLPEFCESTLRSKAQGTVIWNDCEEIKAKGISQSRYIDPESFLSNSSFDNEPAQGGNSLSSLISSHLTEIDIDSKYLSPFEYSSILHYVDGGLGIGEIDHPSCSLLEARAFLSRKVSAPEIPNRTAQPEIRRLERACLLNRCDWNEVNEASHLLTLKQSRLLDLVENKPRIFPGRFDDLNYLPQSSLLILSEYPSAERYAFCCVPNQFNPLGQCKHHKFCPYCNYLVRQSAVERYLPGFYRGNWHWVTISSSGELPFESKNAFDCLDYWNAGKRGLQLLVKSGLIRGAYWVEEMKVLSFLPTRVMPHIHALIDADAFGPDTIAVLEANIRTFRTGEDEPLALEPNVDVRPVPSEKSMFNRLSYMFKVVDLVSPYTRAWTDAASNNRKFVWRLNSEARECISGIFEITKFRDRMSSRGTLHPNHPRFVGLKKSQAETQENREYVRQIREQDQEFSIESDEHQELELGNGFCEGYEANQMKGASCE